VTLANDLRDAEQALAEKGKSFYWARQLLCTRHANRATRLYRFCRYVDDLADEDQSTARSKKNITVLRDSIHSGATADTVIQDGITLINDCQIDKRAVLDLIAGVWSDTELVRMADDVHLLQYCYQVAGTVGLMMCKVLDTDHPEAEPFAIDLGMAMQLTNICRDVQTDALADRRYIPSTLVNGLAPSELIHPSEEHKQLVQQAVATLLNLADAYYQSGEKGLSYLPFRARLAILVAARLYREIGQKLKRRQYEYWHQRIVVSKAEKFMLTIKVLLTAPLSAKFWRYPSRHDAKLHAPLAPRDTKPFVPVQGHAN
jgi:15-cis-phytoene synthase